MLQVFFVGLIALLIGIAFCFSGYRFFRFLMPLWGFLAGFSLGASAVTVLFGGGFLATALGWIVGIVVGLILASLVYFFYTLAVVILGASVGYWVGTGLMTAIGLSQQGFLALIVGVILAVIFAILTLSLNLPKVLIIVFSALGGASTIIAGILLLLGRIPLASLQFEYGTIEAIIRGSGFWGLVWIILAIAGIVAQWRSTQGYTLAYS